MMSPCRDITSLGTIRLNKRQQAGDKLAVVILDFSNVLLGVNSLVAQSIMKLTLFIQKNFHIKIILFITGHKDGSCCSYDLSKKVLNALGWTSMHVVEDEPFVKEHHMSLAAR
jgi:hypothetical protein